MENNDNNNQIKKHPIKENLNNTTPKIYFQYWCYITFSMFLGIIMKIIYKLKREKIGKKRLITGIPILRNYFFFFPTIISIIFFIYLLIICNKKLKSNYNNSLIKYLKKIRSGFIITNSILFFYFFLIYQKVFLPVKSLNLKISGHIFAALLSGAMLIHIKYTSNIFIISNLETQIMKIFYYLTNFLLFHNVYTIFWSSWIFHKIFDLVFSLFFGILSLSFIHFSNFDKLILTLMDNRIQRKKEKNVIYKNYNTNFDSDDKKNQ